MRISSTEHQKYGSDDPRLFADLMASPSPVIGGGSKNAPAAPMGKAGASRMAFAPGNFSANSFAVNADQEPGNPHVLGSLSRRPDSYFTNESVKETQFFGYGANFEAPVNGWINARVGSVDNDPRVPVTAAGDSDLRTDALSSYSAALKLTQRSDAGAYHYGQPARVALDHGLENYGQIINLGGKNSTLAASFSG